MAASAQNDRTAEQMNSAHSECPIPILTLSRSIIRPHYILDAPSIAREANNLLISQWMRNLFPSPYTLADAEDWVALSTKSPPLRAFAITRPDGTYIGGIGLKPFTDVEARTMEIGYWLGEAHWGAGIMTQAVAAFSRWAFETIPELLRLEAGVFSGNEGSMTVLRKAGYTFEGRRRNAVFKNRKVLDVHMFSLLREECLGSQE
ncbi:acetyltransferase [Mycena polygramma]|nr:acetyltransferase [Mycena polygramma]